MQSIFTILAAILHVGDVSFVPHGSNDGVRVKNDSTIEKSRIQHAGSEREEGRMMIDGLVADLLQLSSMDFS